MFLVQIYVDTLVKKAYENWNQVIEYDGKSLLGVKQTRRSARNETQVASYDYNNSVDHQQILRLPVPFSSEHPSADSSLPVGGLYYIIIFFHRSSYIQYNAPVHP